MLSSTFPLITLQDTIKNLNSEYGLTQDVQLGMANGNTQFAIDVAREMKISFSIPTIALQIVSRFYHLRSYINYDRFMIIMACLVLALKMRYMEFRFNDIVYAFYRVRSFKCNITDLYDEKIRNRIKDEICVAENQVLRTLEYDIDITTPHDYLPQILQISFPGELKTPGGQRIRLTTRILILDSNRVQTSLYFSPLTISIASLMIACRYENLKPYLMMGNKATNSTNGEKSDEELYVEWLDAICAGEKQKIKQEEVLACVKHMNKVMKLISEGL